MQSFAKKLITVLFCVYGVACLSQTNNNIKSQNALKSLRKLSLADVFRIKEVSDLQISPDGNQIAYVLLSPDSLNDNNSVSIWTVRSKTESHPIKLVNNAHSPKWSPDGQKLAFIKPDLSGKEQVFCITKNAHIQKLTNVNQAPYNISWSPDGKSICFSMYVPEQEHTFLHHQVLKKPLKAKWSIPAQILTHAPILRDGEGITKSGHAHLFLCDLSNLRIRQLTKGNYQEDSAVSWSPDSRFLVYSSDRSDVDKHLFYQSAIYKLELSSASVLQISHKTSGASNPTFSDDGRFIAFTGVENTSKDYEQNNLYIMNADGSNEHLVNTTLDRDVSQAKWVPGTHELLATYDDDGNSKIGLFSLNGQVSTVCDHLDGDVQYNISKNHLIVYPGGIGERPADIFIHSLKGGKDIVFKINRKFFEEVQTGSYKELTVVSSKDNVKFGAFLQLPPHFSTATHYPLVLMIHGGPHGDDGERWSLESQFFAANGYIVLTVNYRGSLSYGFDFAEKLQENFPECGYNDLMDATNAAIATGLIDPTRTFVTGGSAGGELCAWIVGKTNRFNAAVAEKPIINDISMSLTSDQFFTHAKQSYNRTPWEDPMLFWKHSPLALVDNVQTPTLLIVGDDDYRTPKGEAMQFYNSLIIRRVPTAFVLVPGAGHASLKGTPSRLAENFSIQLAWFSKFNLKNKQIP